MEGGTAGLYRARFAPSSPTVMTPSAERVLELRSYRLYPGKRDEFHRLFEDRALPMLRAAAIDVVAYGPSADSADGYFLMRSFPSLETRRRALDAFYGSPAPAAAVDALRQLGRITSGGAGSA